MNEAEKYRRRLAQQRTATKKYSLTEKGKEARRRANKKAYWKNKGDRKDEDITLPGLVQ